MTGKKPRKLSKYSISTHTLRGERDYLDTYYLHNKTISTHTLRGERDVLCLWNATFLQPFQLTRSVGSVTRHSSFIVETIRISTHTLRGERDWEQEI